MALLKSPNKRGARFVFELRFQKPRFVLWGRQGSPAFKEKLKCALEVAGAKRNPNKACLGTGVTLVKELLRAARAQRAQPPI